MGPKLLLASFVLRARHAVLHRGELEEARVAAAGARRARRSARSIPAGIEPLEATREQFHDALTRESHTLKRALTDPHLFSGIGNAYSDEILHAARLSPLKLTRSLTDEEFARLHDATRATLHAMDRPGCATQTGGGFPEKVTAFHDEMAVHGRFKQPCPVCGSAGAADRLRRRTSATTARPARPAAGCSPTARSSRLLKDDWPRSIDEL